MFFLVGNFWGERNLDGLCLINYCCLCVWLQTGRVVAIKKVRTGDNEVSVGA